MFDPGQVAGEIPEQAFPRQGSPAAKLAFLLRYAVLAPSNHNTQPWRFKLREQEVELYTDRRRALPSADPLGRELTISCGAALFYLRLAIRYFGYSASITLFPSVEQPDFLARIRLGPEQAPSAADKALFYAIPRRHTTRSAFGTWELPAPVQAALQEAARDEGAELRLISDALERQAVIDLIVAGARSQRSDPQWRDERDSWRLLQSAPPDDSPPKNMPRPSERGPAGGSAVEYERTLAESAPVLAVLGTTADTPHDWLIAGQALAHVLLRAAADGVAAAFLNQPIQVAELRPTLRAILTQPGDPQLGLGLGYGREAQPTPRRDVYEVLG